MGTTAPRDTISALATIMANARLSWMIVGSVAGLFYGRNRTTDDIDIVVDCSNVDPVGLSRSFAPVYMLDEEMVRTSVAAGMMFNAIPLLGGPKVDLIPLGTDPFDREAFRRRRVMQWADGEVPVIRPDDLVISNLRWAKDSESGRQLADVRAMLALGLADEHERYFQGWVARLDLQATLDAARSARYER